MMAEECTHDCSSCGSACASRQKPQSLLAPANAGSRVKKVIGVVSGKGGVGKSLVTGLLACETARRGKIAGVLDADITGPSMPRILGIRDKAVGNELGILPQEAENGVKVMSINLLLEHDTDPVIWRGSLIAGTVKQFWTDVCWGGCGLPVCGYAAGNGRRAADGVPVAAGGWHRDCLKPAGAGRHDCGKSRQNGADDEHPGAGLGGKHGVHDLPGLRQAPVPLGEGRTADVAKQYGLPMLAQLPIQPELAKKCDEGRLMDIQLPEMGKAVDAVLKCKVRKHE